MTAVKYYSTGYQANIRIRFEGKEIFKGSFSKFPIVFGRSEECHIPFPAYRFLSKVHGYILLEDGVLTVGDFDSMNGIYHNESRFHKMKFGDNAKFNIGDLQFVVELEAVEEFSSAETQRVILKPAPVKAATMRSIAAVANPETAVSSSGVKPPPGYRPSLAGVVKPMTQSGVSSPALAKIPPTLSEVAAAQEPSVKTVGGGNTDRFNIDYDPRIMNANPEFLSVQGVVTWGKDIFDVRQFQQGESLILGPNDTEPIFLPTTLTRMNFGYYRDKKAQCRVPKGFSWRMTHAGREITFEEAVQKKKIYDQNQYYLVDLGFEDTCSIDIAHDISLHIRYVEQERPFIGKTIMENREEFKKAFTLSGIVHLAICLLCLFAPKPQAPVVQDVPERFAKLLVEPPPQILAAPTPTTTLPPEPPPTTLPIVKKEPPKKEPPQKVVKKQIQQKVQPKATPVKQVAKQVPQKQQPVVNAEPPPKQPTKEEQEAANLMAALGDLADVPKANTNKNIKIDNIPAGGAGPVVKTGDLLSSVKMKTGKLSSAIGMGGGGGTAKIAGAGFKGGVQGGAGKRQVAAAVVGVPKFNVVQGPKGLKDDEVMKTVNKYVAEIQQCYERALFQDSSVAGRVEYEWTIQASGNVSTASVKRSEVANGDFLNNCVVGIIKKMKFPKATNGQETPASIGFPFGRS